MFINFVPTQELTTGPSLQSQNNVKEVNTDLAWGLYVFSNLNIQTLPHDGRVQLSLEGQEIHVGLGLRD